MSKAGYKVTSFMVCDDVRREDNGKEIIIGIYNKAIIVSMFPVQLPQLTFRVIIEVEHSNFHECFLSVTGPKRKLMTEFQIPINIESVDDPIHIVFGVRQPGFHEAGSYRVSLGLDGPKRKIGEFDVRLPVSPTERRRVKVSENSA